MKSHMMWALVGASVVALGYSSMAATGAAWRASAPASDEATLSSGKLDISAGSSGTTDYVLSDFGMQGMTASSAVAKPLEVFNSGNVPLEYTIQSVSVTPVAPATAAPPLTLAVTAVSGAGACTSSTTTGGVYSGPMDGASTAVARSIAAGGSEFLCLRAGLASGSTAGQAGTATFTFRASVDR